MSNIKLTYFNTRGVADTIRMLLKYGNIKFEDNRIKDEDWPVLRASTPFGLLPVYEEDGKLIHQSLAIARYIAKKVNLVGDNDWENLEIDALADTISDLRGKILDLFPKIDNEEKEKSSKVIISETLPFCFERFDKIVAKNGGQLVGKKVTWVDIYLVSIVEIFEVLLEQKDILKKYENLEKLKNKIHEIPAIKSFIETRPKTYY